MSKIEKLLQKARNSPQNLRFEELRKLCVHFGMELAKSEGSHFIYSRKDDPKFIISIQEDKGGKAKTYQVKQLLDNVEDHGLYDFKEEG